MNNSTASSSFKFNIYKSIQYKTKIIQGVCYGANLFPLWKGDAFLRIRS